MWVVGETHGEVICVVSVNSSSNPHVLNLLKQQGTFINNITYMKRSATCDELKAALVIILSSNIIILRPFPFVQTDVKCQIRLYFRKSILFCEKKSVCKFKTCKVQLYYTLHINIPVADITCTFFKIKI